jgi:hypothetical protein
MHLLCSGVDLLRICIDEFSGDLRGHRREVVDASRNDPS